MKRGSARWDPSRAAVPSSKASPGPTPHPFVSHRTVDAGRPGAPPRPVAIRRARPADAAPLAAFAARAFHATYAPPHGDSRPADVAAYVDAHFSRARQRAELADPARCTLVAEREGAFLGYAQLRRGSLPGSADGFAAVAGAPPEAAVAPAVELARLYVDRDSHGTGVAAALVGAARAVAAGWGADAFWCAVYQRSARAIAFYRKEGARTVGTGTFRMGGELQHDWIVVLPATSPAPP